MQHPGAACALADGSVLWVKALWRIETDTDAMKAAYINQTGSPDLIIYGDLPTPKPTRSQCLVEVAAVDVNPIDVYVRSGMIPAKLSFPFILGRDLAGTIAEVGPDVKRFKPGDRVWATNQGMADRPGTFAELAAIDERWLHKTPDGVADEDVVALSLVGVTAHLGLVRDAKLKAGEILFVNGGTGGVGACVLQMAKLLGARVIATAGTDDKAEACRQLGADLALNYKTADVDAAVRQFAPAGINVWWETLREPDFERSIPLLAMRGRMIVMAGRDARPAFPVGPFYTKDCMVHGFAMFNATAEEEKAAANAINRWVADGKLKARIDRVLPLAEAAEAHRLQEQSTIHKSGTLAGKIVLKPPAASAPKVDEIEPQ
jgi:NADPH:quinone reductase